MTRRELTLTLVVDTDLDDEGLLDHARGRILGEAARYLADGSRLPELMSFALGHGLDGPVVDLLDVAVNLGPIGARRSGDPDEPTMALVLVDGVGSRSWTVAEWLQPDEFDDPWEPHWSAGQRIDDPVVCWFTLANGGEYLTKGGAR